MDKIKSILLNLEKENFKEEVKRKKKKREMIKIRIHTVKSFYLKFIFLSIF